MQRQRAGSTAWYRCFNRPVITPARCISSRARRKEEQGMIECYAADDVILPSLTLENPCEIRIDITPDRVFLRVGQRDWDWKRGCPDVSGCGTMISEEGIPDE